MIELFLSPGDEGGQTLRDGLGENSLEHTGNYEPPLQNPDPGGDQQSLADQGWGVVVPKGDEGDRLLALIQPLIDRRAEERGKDVSVYRVKPDLDKKKSASWRDRVFEGNLQREEIPWYLLILGQPTQVSLEFQQVMSSRSLVGRLAFDRESDYESYVAKILSWENQPPGEGLARAMYCTATDGSQATALGHEALMVPSAVDARERKENGRFAVSEVVEMAGDGGAFGDDLLAAAAVDTPSILFSCSHGMGAPAAGWSSSDRQRALQGAVYLGDRKYLTGEDVRNISFLPGGMWFLFACFGAGTPGHSAYRHWLARLQELGEFGGSLDSVLAALPQDGDPPFIASLPQAALANPDGPLAVIGHLDLAWSYSFQDMDKFRGRERHRRFLGTLTDMARGDRAGFALKDLLGYRGQIEQQVAIYTDEAAKGGGELSEAEATRLGHRWMLHQDLDGYVLLGDPAARLPIDRDAVAAEAARRRRAARNAATQELARGSTPSISTPAATSAPALLSAAVDFKTMVEIVGMAIREEATPKKLARQHGITRETIDEWVREYDQAGQAALKKLTEG